MGLGEVCLVGVGLEEGGNTEERSDGSMGKNFV